MFGTIPVMAFLGGVVTTAFGLMRVFDYCEKTASPNLKRSVREWLERPPQLHYHVGRWPTTFLLLFDQVFGREHVSRKCFLRSCLASLMAVIVLIMLWIAVRPGLAWAMYERSGLFGWEGYGSVLAGAAIINFVPDYLSLLETRYVISRMQRCARAREMFFYLAVDLAASALIILFVLFVAVEAGQPGMRAGVVMVNPETGETVGVEMHGQRTLLSPAGLAAFWSQFVIPTVRLEPLLEGRGTFGLFFYSTFVTSLWAWLYAAAGGAVRAAWAWKAVHEQFTWAVDVETAPIRAVGVVAVLLWLVISIVAMPFVVELSPFCP